MTTIGMHYEVIPGKKEDFIGGFLATLEVMKTLPGHVESHLYEDVQSKGSFVIFSQWKRKEDFEAFIHSDAFRKTVTWGKEQILRGRPQHKVYLNQ
ncbi:MAG: antibiotic biosynthesis monooxygenase [Tepidisphaeraceae bacterium]